jgi:hypothetical protein
MTWTMMVFLILLATLAIALLALLLSRREPWYLDEAPESFRTLQRAYEKTLRTLKDIEFDFQVGTLSEEEHVALRIEYKRRAVAIRGALERSRLAGVRRIAAGQSAGLSPAERSKIEELVKKARSSQKELIET